VREEKYLFKMRFQIVGFATTNGFPGRVLSSEEIINLIAASHWHFPTKQCLVIECVLSSSLLWSLSLALL